MGPSGLPVPSSRRSLHKEFARGYSQQAAAEELPGAAECNGLPGGLLNFGQLEQLGFHADVFLHVQGDHIKDLFIAFERPTSLDGIKDLAILVDRQMQAHCRSTQFSPPC